METLPPKFGAMVVILRGNGKWLVRLKYGISEDDRVPTYPLNSSWGMDYHLTQLEALRAGLVQALERGNELAAVCRAAERYLGSKSPPPLRELPPNTYPAD